MNSVELIWIRPKVSISVIINKTPTLGMKSVCELKVAQKGKDELRRRIVR